jgi:hypothetical protein
MAYCSFLCPKQLTVLFFIYFIRCEPNLMPPPPPSTCDPWPMTFVILCRHSYFQSLVASWMMILKVVCGPAPLHFVWETPSSAWSIYSAPMFRYVTQLAILVYSYLLLMAQYNIIVYVPNVEAGCCLESEGNGVSLGEGGEGGSHPPSPRGRQMIYKKV